MYEIKRENAVQEVQAMSNMVTLYAMRYYKTPVSEEMISQMDVDIKGAKLMFPYHTEGHVWYIEQVLLAQKKQILNKDLPRDVLSSMEKDLVSSIWSMLKAFKNNMTLHEEVDVFDKVSSPVLDKYMTYKYLETDDHFKREPYEQEVFFCLIEPWFNILDYIARSMRAEMQDISDKEKAV